MENNTVNNLQPETTVSTTNDVQNAPPIAEQISEQPKKKKTGLIIAIIVIVLGILAALYFLVLNDSSEQGISLGKVDSPKATYITAKKQEDGTAYIPLMNGETIKINNEVNDAVLTADKEHLIVLLEDHTLYISDKDQTEKTILSENIEGIEYVRDTGFFYYDEDYVKYRYTFEDASELELGEVLSLKVAENTLSALYVVNDKVYILPSDAIEGNRIKSTNNTVYVNTISDDGTIAVWTEKDSNDEETIVLCEGDETTTLGTVNYKYNYTKTVFSKDQNTLVIFHTYGEEMWIKNRGQEPVKTKLASTPYNSVIYTPQGLLKNVNSGDVSSFYIATDSDSGSNLYNVSLDGDKERVLSKVEEATIIKDHVIYLDEEGNLFIAKCDGINISEEQKIASDVQDFIVSKNQKYVYYGKDYDSDADTISLYSYCINESDPVKVSSDVYTFWGFMSYIDISSDGETVIFVKEPESITDTYTSMGILTKWKYGSGELEKITSDVVATSTDSYLSDTFDPNSFTFLKYDSVNEDNEIVGTWYYYNGTEIIKIASEIIE